MISGGKKLIEELKDKFGEIFIKDRYLENEIKCKKISL